VRGRLDAECLKSLQEFSNKGGNIGISAIAVLDLAQGIVGEKSPQEVAVSIVKLGFVYGVGFVGEAIGDRSAS
jgi:hypothetical protein